MGKFVSKNSSSKKDSKKNFVSKPNSSNQESTLFSLPKKVFGYLKQKLVFLKYLDPFTYVDLFVLPPIMRLTNNSKKVEFIVNIVFAFLFALLIYFLLSVLFGSSSPMVIVYSASMEPTFFRGDVMALTRVSDGDYFGPEVILSDSISVIDSPTINYATPVYSTGKDFFLEKIVFSLDENTFFEVTPSTSGEVIVYSAFNPLSGIHGAPIIHRAIAKIVSRDGNFVLTKGDNSLTNFTFDQDCGLIHSELGVPQKNCVSFYAIPIESIEGKAFFRIPIVGCTKIWVFDNLYSLLVSGSLPPDYRGFC